jgi:hypothetical protein
MLRTLFIFILFAIVSASCNLQDPGFVTPGDELILITTDRNSVTADGQEVMTLSIDLSPDLDTQLSVVVSTNFGALDNNANAVSASTTKTLTLEPVNHHLVIYLQADSMLDVNELIIQVTVQNIATERKLPILRAEPDDLLLTTSVDSFAAGDSLNLGIQLDRQNGSVTDHTKIFFSVTPDTNGANGVIVPYCFSDGNRANVRIRSSSAVTGTVNVRAFVVTANNDTLSRDRLIRIY